MNLREQPLLKTGFLSSLKSLWCVFWRYREYEITKTTIEANESILQNRFTQLRQKSEDLGASRWALLKCQTVCMLVAMLFLIVLLLIK
jgi:hypothetical protein